MRVSELDKDSDTYTMSAYLIAQLGKNHTGGKDKEISGNALIELAWMMLEKTQYMFGGRQTASDYGYMKDAEDRNRWIIDEEAAALIIAAGYLW